MDQVLIFEKEKAAQFDEEREAYLDSFGSLQRETSVLQQQRSNLIESWNHIFMLQNQISDSKVMLQADRLCLHTQHGEIGELRVVQRQNHLRLQELLEATRPLLDPHHRSTVPNSFYSEQDHDQNSGLSSARGEQDSLLLPSPKTQELWKAEVKRLRQEVQWFDQSYNQRMNHLLASRAQETSLQRKEVAEVMQTIESILKEIKTKENLLHNTTKDFLSLRHTALIAHRAALDLNRGVAQQKVLLQKNVQHMHQEQLIKVKQEQESFGNRAESMQENLVSQTERCMQEIAIIGAQHASLEKLYSKRYNSLRNELNIIKKKFGVVRTRFSLELQGFSTELAGIEGKKVAELENWFLDKKRISIYNNEQPSSLVSNPEKYISLCRDM
eukprot:CAMPEP_0117743212 /NCGR_PEP_ID=MMETSP0947-20121206/5996_1 /TAXON_ID=44440 /ORGANISM="Chattonella subsalsa, Strain CCMP2191" /LENGTH=384 /DNA_ID=CAMNT_0005559861 /DNA_START=106 /DNA_END=1257 /DNA_ORIENTATION=-